MNKFTFGLIFLGLFQLNLYRQAALPEDFTLVDHAPKLVAQESPNCFAFAAAYVALTTQVAYQNKLKHPDKNAAFSFGFVDGVIADVGKRKVRKAANEKWGGNLEDYNNLDNAFWVLHVYGTVSFSEFPLIEEKNSAKFYRRNKTMLKEANVTLIKDRKELLTPEDTKDEAFIKSLAQYISNGVPIICAINQKEAVCTIEFAGDAASGDNHIVTILGYNLRSRNFIVRNNYDCCNCDIEIGFDEFLRCLRWAYVLEI